MMMMMLFRNFLTKNSLENRDNIDRKYVFLSILPTSRVDDGERALGDGHSDELGHALGFRVVGVDHETVVRFAHVALTDVQLQAELEFRHLFITTRKHKAVQSEFQKGG